MTCGGYKYTGKPVIPILRILNVRYYINTVIAIVYL